ncbi:MAG: hypothetical protein JWO77_2572 [Ilumatobacteraceae bacterium]|nr:hypothetical protein [Ilumatobacteraceae bacterium]
MTALLARSVGDVWTVIVSALYETMDDFDAVWEPFLTDGPYLSDLPEG